MLAKLAFASKFESWHSVKCSVSWNVKDNFAEMCEKTSCYTVKPVLCPNQVKQQVCQYHVFCVLPMPKLASLCLLLNVVSRLDTGKGSGQNHLIMLFTVTSLLSDKLPCDKKVYFQNHYTHSMAVNHPLLVRSKSVLVLMSSIQEVINQWQTLQKPKVTNHLKRGEAKKKINTGNLKVENKRIYKLVHITSKH